MQSTLLQGLRHVTQTFDEHGRGRSSITASKNSDGAALSPSAAIQSIRATTELSTPVPKLEANTGIP
jgi:hypothetical protein